MHDGCQGSFSGGAQIVDKLRQMGFSKMTMPIPTEIQCQGCGNVFTMQTMEDKCDHCGMVHGVTPCHAHDVHSIQAAGINY